MIIAKNKRHRKALVHMLYKSTAGMTKEKVIALLPIHDEVTKPWTIERCRIVYVQHALDTMEDGKIDCEIQTSWDTVYCHGVAGWDEVDNKEIPTIW
tara:strand:- start:1222 stop:1512 length:291 start_codon:yes stop_codon:yes gene_type:complete